MVCTKVVHYFHSTLRTLRLTESAVGMCCFVIGSSFSCFTAWFARRIPRPSTSTIDPQFLTIASNPLVKAPAPASHRTCDDPLIAKQGGEKIRQ